MLNDEKAELLLLPLPRTGWRAASLLENSLYVSHLMFNFSLISDCIPILKRETSLLFQTYFIVARVARL